MTSTDATNSFRLELVRVRSILDRDPTTAEAEARRLSNAAPDDPAALLLLGRALRATGKLDEAQAAERASVQLAARMPRHSQAIRALHAGDFFRANQLFKQIIDDDGDDVLALSLLGVQASRASEFEIAEDLLGRATRLAPGDVGARLALAEHLHRSRRSAQALEEIARLPDDARKSDQAQMLEADALGEIGRLEEQLVILRGLAEKAGDATPFALRIGHALRSLGRADEAERSYRDIIARHPGEGTAWWSLANLKKLKFSDEEIAAMRSALAIPGAPETNRIRLNFALGKALEDRKEGELAFQHFDAGNRLRAAISHYDGSVISEWVDRSIAGFDEGFFERQGGRGAASTAPIFVVGMQRAGSTLVEQILSAHSQVEATAELHDIPNLVRRVSQEASKSGQTFEQHLSTASAEELVELGESYLASTAANRHTDAPMFTDKMPNNWSHVAFIRAILPNAKIVDVRRDPMDCCVSNWTQLYARGLDMSNALDTMGAYYVDYVRLMRHIDKVQPGAVHRIIYENLVDDLEGEVGRLLAYLGLPFEQACLDFHQAKRAVRTISAEQVRQPINRKGIGRWRMYEPWVAPLVDALGPIAKDWQK